MHGNSVVLAASVEQPTRTLVLSAGEDAPVWWRRVRASFPRQALAMPMLLWTPLCPRKARRLYHLQRRCLFVQHVMQILHWAAHDHRVAG